VGTKRVNGPPQGASGGLLAWIDPRRIGWIRLLLAAVPVAIVFRLLGLGASPRFIAAALAIIPLAGLMGEATEHLARRLGPGIGGLLNATFGNAAELIIALFALFKGLDAVVKASLTGSIIGNLLLVLGASLLAGGVKHRTQRFNRTAAGIGGTMMVLAAMGMLVPAIFHALPEVTAKDIDLEHELSVAVCAILMLTYFGHLFFSLRTHTDLFNPDDEAMEGHAGEPPWPVGKATLVLLAATGLVAWMSEILVGAVEATSQALGMNEVFVGVIVVAIIGNAAEHSTAILMAMKNQMDLAVGIALGSALQIALFVAPVLVFASYLRPHPMDLLFTTLEVLSVILAVTIARMVAEDGESNWLEGLMLLMIYAILGVAFFVLPERQEDRPPGAAQTAAEEPGT
jgi:Ca2+:H+ antiporter